MKISQGAQFSLLEQIIRSGFLHHNAGESWDRVYKLEWQHNIQIPNIIYPVKNNLRLVFPVFMTLKTSASLTALTLGIGTSHLPWNERHNHITFGFSMIHKFTSVFSELKSIYTLVPSRLYSVRSVCVCIYHVTNRIYAGTGRKYATT